jgi:hypothetical protein
MQCDEYRKLNLEHEYALERVKRYAHPLDEPALAFLDDAQVKKRLDKARAEVVGTRLAMDAHLKTCDVCDQPANGEQVHNPEREPD